MTSRQRRRCPSAIVLLGFLITVSGFLAGCLSGPEQPGPARTQTELGGSIFGTTWSVKLAHAVGQPTPLALESAIQERLEKLDQELSTYIPDSDLMVLNRYEGPEPHPIPPSLFEVLTVSQEINQRSEGAFDVTVAPLVDLWGFGRRKDLLQIPDAGHITALLRHTGSDRFHLSQAADALTVRKDDPKLWFDLSAVAKGYAVDVVSEDLLARGLQDFLVEIGGEIRVSGHNQEAQSWSLAVERPTVGLRSIAKLLRLNDDQSALATSGDYRNFYELEGRRYSHTLDPKTGSPVTHQGASVSVVASNCAEADAWATALLVLGPDRGLRVATREGIAALFLTYDDNHALGYRETQSPALDHLTTNPR